MPRFKVSIIGLGRICCHYLKILNSKEFNNVNITSVCDIKKNKLYKIQYIQEEHLKEIYGNLKK